MMNTFQRGIILKKKFAPKGSNLFPLRVVPFKKGSKQFQIIMISLGGIAFHLDRFSYCFTIYIIKQ